MDTATLQALAGVVAGIIKTPCDAYTSGTAHDVLIVPNGAVWLSQTVTLAFVQLDGMGTHGVPTVAELHTSQGIASSETLEESDPLERIAVRIRDAVQMALYIDTAGSLRA